MKSRCRRPSSMLPGCCLAGAALLAGPLARAEAEPDLFDLPLEQLEHLIVTAQKRPESLQSVPVAVSAFSGERLLSYGVTDTQHLQQVTPGLVYNNTGSSAQPFVRGVGTRFAFAGLEPSVATYVDDRYVARAQAGIFELADVERVEVLKGPQGTLYGRNATGGAIRVVTREVDETFTAGLRGSLGNYDLRTLSGTVSGPLTPDLGARLSALVKRRDGYADNLQPGAVAELDDQDYLALRGKLRWDTNDWLTSRLTLAYQKREDNNGNDLIDLSPPGLNAGIAAGGISGRDRDHVATAIDSVIDSETLSGDLRLDIDLAGATLVSITTFTDFDQITNTDADGTSARVVDAVPVPTRSDAFSQELQLLSDTGGPWEWLAGAYYFAEDADFEIVLDTGPNGVESFGDQSARTSAYALFGQVTHKLSTRWAVTLGGRWSIEEKDASVRASRIAATTTAPVPFDDDERWKEFTPKATLERRSDAGLVYLSYARGFKSGGYNYPASVGNSRVLDPEILDMIELGWKAQLLNDRLRVNGAIYYYDYDDLQVTRASEAGGSVVTTTENAANAIVLGADLDLTWSASERLSLSAGLNVLDTEYRDFEASANVFNAVLENDPTRPGMSSVVFDASGDDLLRAADFSAFLSAEYRFDLPFGTLPLVVTYSYTDDYQFDLIADPSSDALRQDGYGLLSARATVVDAADRWSLAVWGANLTDEDDYYMDIVANAAGIRGSPGAPRTWGIDVGYRF